MFFNIKKGFTLPELLVGIVLVSIVSEGAFRMLGNVINTDEYEKSMIYIQEDVHHISEFISSDIKKAGFFINDQPNKQPFIWGNTKSTGTLTGDSFEVTYQNVDNSFNCNGIQELPNIKNKYYVTKNTLYCGDKELLNNVEVFQVLYGIDFNLNGKIDRFVSADIANGYSNDPNNKIIAIKLDIIASSSKEYTSSYEKSFNVIGLGNVSFNDGKVYRSINRTIILKNML